ncbi:MAG TPA: alpha/beta hydrolase [Acidimicrobiales bacterium]|nr:alpha/beta hydrolase [Acidimicrobiales bacterium]
MTVTDRVVALGDVELAISEAGRGGRPLLLVHGYTGAGSDFEDFVEPLAELGWHVVTPDLRGHGGSSKPADESAYGFDIFAADLLGLADALGWDRFVLLGHSMGGMIAQVLTLGSPERVGALILMDTGHGSLTVDADLIDLAVATAREQGIDVVADFMGASDDGPLASDAYRRKVAEDPSYKERGDRNLRKSSPAMFAAMILQISTTPDRLPELPSIAAPTLVIVGEEDAPFLGASRRMAEAIPDARLEVIPGGGHSPQFEAPEGWWAAMSSFLGSLGPAPT